MYYWKLIQVLIFFVIINPSFGSTNVLDNVLEVLKKVIPKEIINYFINENNKYRAKEYPDSNPKNWEKYDFIIVGAGSAGSLISSRLSEMRDKKILLLEAGGNENWAMDIPLAMLSLQLSEDFNWGYTSEPSRNYCLSNKNHQCILARGKAMGGSSSINAMIATRGNKYDYNEWAELTGDDNWSYKNMLKYFKKLENFNVSTVKTKCSYHNFDGPIHITDFQYYSPLATSFIKAGEEMGFSHVDYNGRSQTGFSYVQTNQINGERLSTNRAYLHPLKGKRNNLSISMNSHVNKILIDKRTKTAYGVEFIKNGKSYRVIAKKEVILSAGAIGTPQILMLSGIGPRKHLKQVGIDVLEDLPVGKHLMDHVGYSGLLFFVNDTNGLLYKELLSPENRAMSDYLTKRSGILSTTTFESLAFVNVDHFNPKNDKPNMELIFSSGTVVADELAHVVLGMSEKYWKNYFADKLNQHGWTIIPMITKPKSRGRILLRNNDPKAKPKIYTNYLSHRDDVRVLIKGIRLAIEISKTEAMKRHGSILHDRIVPDCEKHVYDSDAYWECALRTFTTSIWHLSGTCKMGHDNDKSAVVNSRLQVKGITNLRVADASVMPTIVTGHTNIPTMAIAERLADMLKSKYTVNESSIYDYFDFIKHIFYRFE